MKQTSTPQRLAGLLMVILSIFSLSNKASAQLKGTYTIDGTSSASSTNYKTFTSAVSDLVSGTRTDGGTANGKGVAGAVTFNIVNGSYKEKISIAAISGASATNTITFQSKSGDSSKVILYDSSSTSSTKNYTLEINAAKFITFKNITIARVGTNTYGIAVQLSANTKNIQFIGNLIYSHLDPSNTSTSIAAGNTSAINSTGADSNFVFNGNRIKYGYNCIALTGTSPGANNQIINNVLDTGGMAGVYATNQQTNLLVSGNTFNMGAFSTSGHYVSYGVRLESAVNFKVVKNKFYATSGASVSRCIVMFNATTSGSSRNLIANNFAWVSAGSTSSTGITLGGNSNLDIVYNNVLMTSVPSSSAALYYYASYTGSSNVILNNNFINKGTGTAIDNSNPSGNGYNPGISRCNYNNLYTKGTYIGNYQGTLYKTLSAWQTATSTDSNSVNLDPGYTSNTDLHVSSSGVNGKGLPFAAVTDDIDGDKRDASTPDIGADEFTPTTLDAGITSLDSPATFCAPQKANLLVKFTNFGANTLTSLKINWSINGVTQTPYSWSGSVSTGNVSSSVNIGSYTFSSKSPYLVKIWTSAPNGSTDQKASNDTLSKTIASGLSGTYTIGGTTPDFKSFNDALDAITLRGLCGATVFNVRNGTYNEQLTIPNYPSLSATNTLTFQSEKGDSSKVILTLTSVSANGVNNVVLQLNGCRYVTFKGITILRTGSGIYQSVIELKGKACNNTFLNNRIIGVQLAASNTTGDVIVSSADADTANTFKNNLIRYGNFAINLSGDAATHETGNIIDGNTIDSCYASGMILTYNDGIIVRNNKMTNISYGGTASNGIQLSSCNYAIKITANKVYMPSACSVGLFLINCTGKSGAEGLIANNYLSLSRASGNLFGIYDSVSTYQNFYYNSVTLYGVSTSANFYENTTGNTNLKNNIFNNNGGGFCIIAANTSGLASSDYNDLYSVIANIGAWGSSVKSDLAAWQSASGLDANSVSITPGFVSNTDYHTKSPDIHGKATPLTAVTNDIESTARSKTKPSIGALEFRTAKNDAGIPGLDGSLTVCEGTDNITVKLKNSGSDTLKSATINWKVAGVTQTAYSFSGKIKPDSTASITIGTYKFAAGFAGIKIWSSSPNGKTDSFPANDTFSTTITVNALPAAITGAAATICSGQSVTLGGTAVSGNKYIWKSHPDSFNSTFAKVTVTPNQHSTWYVLTETSILGCTKTDSVLITMNPSPKINIGTRSFTVCAGDSIQVGTAAVSGLTYSWKSTPAGFTSAKANPFFTPKASGYASLTVTNTSGCAAKDSAKITYNPTPNATVIKPITVCSGTALPIGGTSVSGDTYSWSSDIGSFTSTLANPSASPSATTVYTLKETITATGCAKTNNVKVTVVGTPTVGTITGPLTICTGSTVIYAPTSSTNGINYIYKTSLTSGSTTSQTGDSLTVHWAGTGSASMWVIAKVTTGTCKDSTQLNINVNPVPKAKFSAGEVCFGHPSVFTNSSTGGIKSTWYFGDGDTLSTASPTHSYKTPGAFAAKLMVLNSSGCFDSAFATVKVDSLPKVSFKVSTNHCLGTPVDFTSTSGASTKNLIWDFGDGATDINPNTSHSYTAAGTYKVVLSATNSLGCSDSFIQMITLSKPPVSTYKITQGHGLLYNFKAADTAEKTYVWDFGDTSAGQSGYSSSHTYSGETSYRVKLTVTNAGGCTVTHDSILKTKYNSAIPSTLGGYFSFDIYPNPFNDKTIISYWLQKPGKVTVILTDITGKLIAKPTDEEQFPGNHNMVIDGRHYNLQQGVYLVSFYVNGAVITKRLVKME